MRLFFKLIFLFLALNIIESAYAQQKYTISGYVKDAKSGEALTGANIYTKGATGGATANSYGFYSLTLPAGKYTLIASFVGYTDFTQAIDLNKNTSLDIQLKPSIMLQKVKISADRPDKNVKSAQMGIIKMDVKQVKELPAFMGETDVLKTIQLLPGVQSAGDGNSGFYVRGGGAGQNLILLDDVPIYHASHLFGFFSVFNGDAIQSVNLIKGSMPARYGGRLASVVDVKMKEGNMKKYEVKGGVGLIAAHLTVQGPIKKDTSSFIISARQTYAGTLVQPFIKKTSMFKGSNYYFYDLNAKVNYILSKKDRIFLSGYFGKDVFNFVNKKDGFTMNFPWGNAIAAVRWNHIFSGKLFMHAIGSFTNYTSKIKLIQNDFEFQLYSGIQDFGSKVEFTYIPSILHNIEFGIDYTHHTFIPSNATAKAGDVNFNTGDIIRTYANDFAAYISDDWTLSEKLKLNIGARFSAFQQVGPFKRYEKDALGNTTDSIVYKPWQNVVLYPRLVPRFSLRYLLNGKSSLKLSYSQNYQYIHLASIASVSLPTDVWVPCSKLVKPQFAEQYAMGYFRNFKDNKWTSSLQLYYKNMKNQVEFKDGTLPESTAGDNIDNNFTFGTGYSYGAELFVKKVYGDFNGWIGYTLSWTKKHFPELNNGEPFFAKYDRRHDISVALTYNLKKRWVFGAVFVYGTGNALTVPVARYTINGYLVSEYGARNSYRMPAYNRLDISATLKGKPHKNYQSNWVLSVYNVYDRHNPFFIYYTNDGNVLEGTLNVRAKQVALFGILPSIAWNFKF